MSHFARTQAAFVLFRLVVGLLFFQNGALKMFGWFGGLPEGVPLTGLTLAAGVLEVGGGALIMVGLLTRPVAFLLSGEMAVAYFIGHFDVHLFWPIENQGQPAVLFCFIFLFISAFGGGDYSVDAVIRRNLPLDNASLRFLFE